MRPWRRVILWSVIVGSLLVVHAVLLRVLVAYDASGALLSHGEHTPLAAIAGLGALMALRLVLIVLMPGFVASRLALWLLRRGRPRLTR